jgi:hypothetical protein
MSTHLRKILYTDFHDMLVLSSTVASCYYNCCTYDSTSPGNNGSPRMYYWICCNCSNEIQG